MTKDAGGYQGSRPLMKGVSRRLRGEKFSNKLLSGNAEEVHAILVKAGTSDPSDWLLTACMSNTPHSDNNS